jgi:hypothetical protein
MYARDGDCYLFLSRSEEDAGAFADEWYSSIDDAERVALDRFGVTRAMWIEVPDPLPGCQADWIQPVRVVGRDEGRPEWGRLERLVDGEWRPFDVASER